MEWGFYYDVELNRMLDEPYIFDTGKKILDTSKKYEKEKVELETHIVSIGYCIIAIMAGIVILHGL